MEVIINMIIFIITIFIKYYLLMEIIIASLAKNLVFKIIATIMVKLIIS